MGQYMTRCACPSLSLQSTNLYSFSGRDTCAQKACQGDSAEVDYEPR